MLRKLIDFIRGIKRCQTPGCNNQAFGLAGSHGWRCKSCYDRLYVQEWSKGATKGIWSHPIRKK